MRKPDRLTCHRWIEKFSWFLLWRYWTCTVYLALVNQPHCVLICFQAGKTKFTTEWFLPQVHTCSHSHNHPYRKICWMQVGAIYYYGMLHALEIAPALGTMLTLQFPTGCDFSNAARTFSLCFRKPIAHSNE